MLFRLSSMSPLCETIPAFLSSIVTSFLSQQLVHLSIIRLINQCSDQVHAILKILTKLYLTLSSFRIEHCTRHSAATINENPRVIESPCLVLQEEIREKSYLEVECQKPGHILPGLFQQLLHLRHKPGTTCTWIYNSITKAQYL